MTSALRILILGGTTEARELANTIAQHHRAWSVLTSLAGRTQHAPNLAGDVRTGGFGGREGLADFLRDNTINALIDATHPFAETISSHAVDACNITNTPRLVLSRAPWQLSDDATVVHANDLTHGANILRDMANNSSTEEKHLRVFLATGRHAATTFADIPHCDFIVRAIDDPAPPFNGATVITARPPFTLAGETALLGEHAIDVLVCKNAGGQATRAKLDAAMARNIPIILIERPLPPSGELVENVTQATAWLEKIASRI